MGRIPSVDPGVPPGALRRQLTAIALSRPGTWFYMNLASRLDPWLIRVTRGRLDSGLRAAPIVLMTARGARSGTERTVPLLYFTDGDDVILMASSFGRPRYPAWYRNIQANPQVRLYARGVSGRYEATEAQAAERDRLYDLAKQLYRGYGVYEDRVEGIRRVPVLRLSPLE